MEPKTKFLITLAVGIILIAGFFYATKTISTLTGNSILTGSAIGTNSDNGNDELAKCLTSKGAKLYGAYWCPHCQEQKSAFGSSLQFIQYIECDSKGENANPGACLEAGISGYPTWIIDGNKYQGAQTLNKLKEITGC